MGRLIEVFPNTRAHCFDCGTQVTNKYRIGTNYYCAEHYEKWVERPWTSFNRKKYQIFKTLFPNGNKP